MPILHGRDRRVEDPDRYKIWLPAPEGLRRPTQQAAPPARTATAPPRAAEKKRDRPPDKLGRGYASDSNVEAQRPAGRVFSTRTAVEMYQAVVGLASSRSGVARTRSDGESAPRPQVAPSSYKHRPESPSVHNTATELGYGKPSRLSKRPDPGSQSDREGDRVRARDPAHRRIQSEDMRHEAIHVCVSMTRLESMLILV